MARSFMYFVAAMGQECGDHMISLLKTQLHRIMEQLGYANTNNLHQHLIKSNSGTGKLTKMNNVLAEYQAIDNYVNVFYR